MKILSVQGLFVEFACINIKILLGLLVFIMSAGLIFGGSQKEAQPEEKAAGEAV